MRNRVRFCICKAALPLFFYQVVCFVALVLTGSEYKLVLICDKTAHSINNIIVEVQTVSYFNQLW